MFNHIYKFSSKKSSKFNNQTSSWKNFKKFSKSSSDKLSFKKFQKIFKVQIKLTLNENKISKIFLSSLQFMETRKKFSKKFQSAKCLVVKFRKCWKYSKSRQKVTIQDGWFEKISKLKLKYGWIKFRKSKSNLSLDWLWYFQSFLENIIEQTIVHSWIYTSIWEENLNSNQIPYANVQIFKLKLRFYVQMYKFKHKYNQVLYSSHVQFTIQDGWRK